MRGVDRGVMRGAEFGRVFPAAGDDRENISAIASIADIAEAQWDATLAASVASGTPQTIANVIASPASGAGQTDYDRWNGADGDSSTDDMTFNGSVGNAAAYLSTDGGDGQKYKTNPESIAPLARIRDVDAANKFTYGIAWKHPTTEVNGQYVWEMGNSTRIFGLQHASGTNLRFFRSYSGSGSNVVTLTNPAAATVYLAVISYDGAANTFRHAINTRTFTEVTDAWDAASLSNISSGNIFSRNGVSFLGAGAEWYGDFFLTGFIGDTELSDIMDYYEALHARDYTP